MKKEIYREAGLLLFVALTAGLIKFLHQRHTYADLAIVHYADLGSSTKSLAAHRHEQATIHAPLLNLQLRR